MDKQTEQLKAELKRVAIEAAEAAICRRLDSLVGRQNGDCTHEYESDGGPCIHCGKQGGVLTPNAGIERPQKPQEGR